LRDTDSLVNQKSKSRDTDQTSNYQRTINDKI
jgi:hypothetical protein